MKFELDLGLGFLLAVAVWLKLLDIWLALIIYFVFTIIFTCVAFVVLKLMTKPITEEIKKIAKKDEEDKRTIR